MTRYSLLALAGGVAFLLAACGLGSGSSGGTTSSTVPPTAFKTIPIVTTTTTTPTTAAAGQSGSGDTGNGAGTYTVKAGDYPLGVAKKLGVTLQALEDANGGGSLNLLPGQKLNIPAASSSSSTTAGSSSGSSSSDTTTTLAPDQPGEYTVRPNDGWSIIAQKLGVDAQTLAAFNDMTLQSTLIPGMKLKIPPSTSSTTSA